MHVLIVLLCFNKTNLPAHRTKARDTRTVVTVGLYRLLQPFESGSVPSCDFPSFSADELVKTTPQILGGWFVLGFLQRTHYYLVQHSTRKVTRDQKQPAEISDNNFWARVSWSSEFQPCLLRDMDTPGCVSRSIQST